MINFKGSVASPRDIYDWEYAHDIVSMAVWFYLLHHANWKDKRWNEIEVKRGQLVISIKTLAEKLSISDRKVRTALERLKSTQLVTLETTSKYTVVTIQNYGEVNRNDTPNDTVTTQQRQQLNKDNKDNNVIKERKEIKERNRWPSATAHAFNSIQSITDKVVEDLATQYGVKVADVQKRRTDLDLYCQKTGRSYKNYRAALQDFIRRDLERGILRVVTTPKDTISEVIDSFKSTSNDELHIVDPQADKKMQERLGKAIAKVREKHAWMNSPKS